MDEKKTGTYRYDKATGKMVKVSDGIPKVASRLADYTPPAFPGQGGCGQDACGGGSCEGKNVVDLD